MDNSVQVFKNCDFSVRTVHDDDGTIWFVAKDVAQALEYSESSIASLQKLIAHVPEIWKGMKRFQTTSDKSSARPYQDMLCLTEQGVYFFLGRSDKKKALPYQMWIAGDVVPSIRETGKYELDHDENDDNSPAVPVPDSTAVPVPDSTIIKPSIQGIIKAAEKIYSKAFKCENPDDFYEVLALDLAFKEFTGKSALQIAGINLAQDCKCIEHKSRSQGCSCYWGEYIPFFKWEHQFPVLPEIK